MLWESSIDMRAECPGGRSMPRWSSMPRGSSKPEEATCCGGAACLGGVQARASNMLTVSSITGLNIASSHEIEDN
jgi:hypothetical protein